MPTFAFEDLVDVIGQPPNTTRSIVGGRGLVLGQTEPTEAGHRYYGVYINRYAQVFCIAETFLAATGKRGSWADIPVHPFAKKLSDEKQARENNRK